MNQLTKSVLTGCAVGLFFATPVLAKDPYSKPNKTWISISGSVKDVNPDSFTLDYGKGVITVEMDDGGRDADGYKLIKGGKVTVNGMIDDDFFEATKIEAGSVYVENIGTYFYASSIDDTASLAPSHLSLPSARVANEGV